MNQKRFNDLYRYLLATYGERLDKICLDGGFTCPNRDGTVGTGGCTFCGSEGAGEFCSHGDIRKAVRAFLEEHDMEEKPKSNRFIVYFQSFTGTYAPLEELKEKYDAALCDSRIQVLSVGTRPDCVGDDVIKLLTGYLPQCDVWVELGFQTANDGTARAFNRGYDTSVFADAVLRLHAAGIKVIAHMMIGLPGESHEDVANTVAYLNRLPIDGVKIHSLYVMKQTKLEEMYLAGDYEPLTMDGYLTELVWCLRHLRPDIVIHRVTGDCARRVNVAPLWAERKRLVLTALNRRMAEENAWQGDRYKEGENGTRPNV